MVVCKFYLQGICKFGSRCRFDHYNPNEDDYRYYNSNYNSSERGTSILRQASYENTPRNNTSVFSSQQYQPPVQQPQKVQPSSNDNSVVRFVVQDILLAEKGGQWKLSCYGPFADKPVFPGFIDYSFEEIRSSFYEARHNPQSFEQFKQHWNKLLNEARQRMKALENPNLSITNMLIMLNNTVVPQPTGSFYDSVSATNQSFFSTQPSSSNVFGIAKKPPSGLFASAALVSQTTKAPSPFGVVAPQTNVFAPSTSSNTNIFQQASSQNQSVFGGSQNQSIFGGSSTQKQSLFGGPQPTVSSSSQPMSTNVFGGPINAKQDDPTIYSKLEELSQEEIAWFKNDDLDVTKIPEKPPAFELCF